MIPTAAQLAALRSRPHLTHLYLSLYQPTIVFSCQVSNGSATKGDRTITYDTVSFGDYQLIQSGMTMYVGTSLGAFDKGTVRVRSATDTSITVAENSHINWDNNDYLTVVNFYEINAVYPRIIQDPSNPTQTLWYKDYDVEYTNQNSILGSFINMGSHYAGFLENGTCNVYYSASGTSNVKDVSLSFRWFFEGASTTGSNQNTPGNIAYTVPGHYTTRLTVTGSTTGADVSYRHISIYDKPGSGQNTPFENWEFMDFSGSREQGGYTAKIRLYETVSSSTLKDGSLIVIFAEDWYGDKVAKQSIGGNSLGRQSILFCGYVMKGSIKYNYKSSFVEFTIGSPTEVMKQAEGFSISVQFSHNPATATSDPNIPSAWVTVLGMNMKRAIYHYLRWQSTLLLTNDFEFKGTDRTLQYFDTDRTSLYDAIHTFMKGTLIGGVVCDRQGKVWAERDIYVEQSAYPTTFTLNNTDWMEDVTIEENRTPRTSFIEMGGIAFYGTGTSYTALLANAPGTAPGYRGNVERKQGLALLDQAELNEIVGNVYAQRNVIYPSLDLNLAGNYRNFDIAPQEKTPVTIASTDTVRGIAFTAKNFYVNRMDWQYDPVKEILLPKMSLIEIGTGFDGDTLDIPPVPDIDNGFTQPVVPPIVIPNFPFGGGGGAGINFQKCMEGRVLGAPSISRYPTGGTVSYDAGETVTFYYSVVVPASLGLRQVSVYACFIAINTDVYPTGYIYANTTLTAYKANKDIDDPDNYLSGGTLNRRIDVDGPDGGDPYVRILRVAYPETQSWWADTDVLLSGNTSFLATSTIGATFHGHAFLWG